MQVSFRRWCVDPNGRTMVSVDPKTVDSTEEFCEARQPRWEGDDDSTYPLCAGTKIVMKGGKKEYLVQGTHEEVVDKLNSNLA